MTGHPEIRRWRKRKIALWFSLALLALLVTVPMAIFVALSSGWANPWIQRTIVTRIGQLTGGPVELQSIQIDPANLRITLQNLTIHGREPANALPLFRADRLELAVSIDNFWRRELSLRDLELTRPTFDIRFEKDGSSNLPAQNQPAASAVPIRQRLFAFVTRRLRVTDGTLIVNDERIPLSASGDRFTLAVDYASQNGKPSYLGEVGWQQFEIAWKDYLAFPSDISARFEVQPNSLTVNQLVWKLPHTSLDTQITVPDLAQAAATFRYRGHFDLQDVRTILRAPQTPQGRLDFNGQGRYGAGQFATDGNYSAEAITLPYVWFHASNFRSKGSYHADERSLTIPDFTASALEGNLKGVVQANLNDLTFRAQTHAQSFSLAAALNAVNNPDLPVNPLHWNAGMDIDAVTTWKGNFKNLDSRGVSFWSPPAELQPGQIPTTAHIDYHYSGLTNTVTLTSSEISTPTSRLRMNGVLGAKDSALDVLLEAEDLLPWNDFINTLRGEDAEPRLVAGKVVYQGRIAGPLQGPTFSGHVKGSQARYDTLFWDSLEGELTYGPTAFRFQHATASRAPSSAQFDVALDLDDWGFDPESPWTFEATLVRTDSDGLQSLLGWSYPVHGLLSGNFHGGGTRAKSSLEGLFDIIDPRAGGIQLDRARGQIMLDTSGVRITNAELRLPSAVAAQGQTATAAGLLTGNFMYGFDDHQIAFDVTGGVVPLAGIQRIQAPNLSVGGQLSFHLSGQGPVLAPKVDGTLRLVDLKLGDDVLGSFQGKIDSDGTRMILDVDSDISTGELHAHAETTLTGDYAVMGRMTLKNVDIDPFITAGLRLKGLTGHSSIDGNVALSGSLRSPDEIQWDVDLSRVAVSYASVNLENNGPVRLQYRRDEVRVQSARLRGLETDMTVSGLAHFNAERALDLRVAGDVNLRLLSAFVADLDAQGPARVDAAIAGTLANPRITGRVRLESSSVRYGDFPAGLSNLTGDLVFDASRISFSNVSAESGGGQLNVDGSLTYGGGPVRYDLTVRSDRVRVRYPVGMSWLAGGTLRMTGDAEAATVSGHITVERLLMAEGFDFSSLVASSSEGVTAPTSTSPFLRNLAFDIQADLAPNARIEWASARFQTEASMRVRGTWEHPILLGHLHLLNGEMQFRGNRYQLSRGDINFANPFRLDPVISIEAATTIRQYEVNVSFDGAASHLTMSYRSDPPLPSSDIIALLAMGQTGEESQLRSAPAGQTSQTGASTLLSEAISSSLGGRIQRLFGISHFSVDPFLSNTTTGGATSARVTISQQVSNNLVITYISNVTSTQQQVIQIEYALRRDISIVALRDENGTFGIDVVKKLRFK